MKEETAIRLQAWFDGEVTAAECTEIEALLDQDPEARAYIESLSRSREVLSSAHVRQTEVERHWKTMDRVLDRVTEKRVHKTITFPRMVSAIAAVMILGMLLWLPFRRAGEPLPQSLELESSVLMVETDLEGATPIVYIDQPSGWTVVWVMEAEEASAGKG